MSDKKKREIIFQVPKAELPPSVKDLMDKVEARMKAADEAASDLLGEPLEIEFHIKNNKVLFSMADVGTAAPAVAKSIVRAVQGYEVKPLEVTPRTQVASHMLGAPKVTYERCVRIDWRQKTIFTNFPPDEGSTFLAAMAIIVEELQGKSKRSEGEPTS